MIAEQSMRAAGCGGEAEPVLSVVLTTRNDDHGGDALARMRRCFLGILAQAEKFKLRTELIIVEWNPPEDRPRLTTAIDWPQGHPYCCVRVIEVPHALHMQMKYCKGMNLYQMIGKNVGIRRARGRYIVCTCMDILFSNELFAFLASGQLAPNVLYRVDRLDVKNEVPEAALDLQLEYCATHVTQPMTKSKDHLLHFNACGDFQLMARENWQAVRGYPEYDLFSWHLDSLLNANAHYGGAPEKVLPQPMCVYHAEHHWGESVVEKEKIGDLWKRLEKQRVPRIDNNALGVLLIIMQREQRSLICNAPDWGMARVCLPETYAVRPAWYPPVSPAAPDPEAAGPEPYLTGTELPEAGRTELQRAQTLMKARRYDEAEQLLQVIWREYPDAPDIACALTQVLMRQNRTAEGMTLLQSAQEKAPDHYDVTWQLGQYQWAPHRVLPIKDALLLMKSVVASYERFLIRHPEQEVLAQAILSGYEEISLFEKRLMRLKIAQTLLSSPLERVIEAYTRELREDFWKIIHLGLKTVALTEWEETFAASLRSSLRTGIVAAPHCYLAAMLYLPPQQLAEHLVLDDVPEWLLDDWWRVLILPQPVFLVQEDIEEYGAFFCKLISDLQARISAGVLSEGWRARVQLFLERADLSPLLLRDSFPADCYRNFEDVTRQFLGVPVEPGARAGSAAPVRLGVLLDNIYPNSSDNCSDVPAACFSIEMPMARALLSAFNRRKVEVFIYTPSFSFPEKFKQDPYESFYPFAKVCRYLPAEFAEQVRILREDNLDVLLHGPSLLEKGWHIALMSCRPARKQVVFGCGVGDPGLSQLNGVITGVREAAASDKCITHPGSGLCFAVASENKRLEKIVTRARPKEAVFVSLTYFRRIPPLMLEIWGRILAQAPAATLALHVFDETANLACAKKAFLDILYRTLARHGVSKNRIILAPILDFEERILSLLQVADVFLDSTPRGDPFWLAQALRLGIPSVVYEGESTLSRRDADMMREVGLTDGIVSGPEAYVDYAVRLAEDSGLRQQQREAILSAMAAQPAFLNPSALPHEFERRFLR